MNVATSALVAAMILAAACDRQVDRSPIAHSDSASGAAPAARAEKRIAPRAGAGFAAAAAPPRDEPLAALTPPVQPPRPAALDSTASSMIIRTGQASIQVDSLDAGVSAVREVARRAGGYVANASTRAGRDQIPSATIELKIPASHFDDVLAGLRPIGKLESLNVAAEDVGEEYVDVTARVANARRLEERLLRILETRTGKLGEVLQVERELARVRGEIERYEGRLRFLRSRTALSTLTVTIHEPLPVVGDRGSGGVIAESVRQAWRNFVGVIGGFIALLGTLVPIAILLAAGGVGALRIWRAARKRTA